MSLGELLVFLGEDSRDRRRSIGELEDEALARERREGFSNLAREGFPGKDEGDGDHDLHDVMRGHAEGTFGIDVAVGVGVGDLPSR